MATLRVPKAIGQASRKLSARLRGKGKGSPSTPELRRVASADEVEGIIERYTWGAAAAMFAIPVPGVDMAATFAVWGAMIREIAKAYGEEISPQDGIRLASELFKDAILTGFAWFGSAKIATTILKFIPLAGTVTAYAVDAGVAALGAKRITSALGSAAALYYGTGKAAGPLTLRDHLQVMADDPTLLRTALAHLKTRKLP